MGEHLVARFDDIPLDSGLIVQVEGRDIGLFRIGDEIHALLNVCPHQGGPVATGGVFPTVEGEIVKNRLCERLNPDRPIVSCPWHGWEFDVRTGVSNADSSKRVLHFDTVVRDGEVSVILPG